MKTRRPLLPALSVLSAPVLLAILVSWVTPLAQAAEVAKYTFDSLANGWYSSAGPAPSIDTDPSTTASPFNFFGLWSNRSTVTDHLIGKKISLRDNAIMSPVLDPTMGFSFTVTPTSPMSLSTVSFACARTANGAKRFGIRYRIGSGTYLDLVTDEPLTDTGSLSDFQPVIVETNLPELQNVTQPVEFRFYAWGASNLYSYSTYLDDFSVTTWDPIVIIPVNFDGFTAGANIAGLPQGNTTWTTSPVYSPSFIKASSDFSFNGGLSLCVYDGESHRLNAKLDFANAGYTPGGLPAEQGRITFYAKEDPNDGTAADEFEVPFSNLAVRRLASNEIVFTLKNKTLANGTADADVALNRGLTTPNYTYNPANWNKFTVEFDNIGKTALLYVNDGYVSSQALRPGEVGDFSVRSMSPGVNTLAAGSRTGDKMYFDAFELDFSAPRPAAPWRSQLYPANWTPGYADTQGRTLQDFSYAGYRAGATAVPTITGPVHDVVASYGADPTGASDSTAAIQTAINAVGNLPGGGVVYLPAGTYKVAPVGSNGAALRINKNNVVLRGAGPSLTRIFNSTADMHLKTVVAISSPSTTSMDWYAGFGNNGKLLTSDVPVGAVVLPVNNTTGINAGDLVTLRNDLTLAFIDEIGNTGLSGWTTPGNSYLGRMLAFSRRVVSVTSNSITVDVPIRYPVKVRDNGRVVKPTQVAVQESGLENFSIGMAESPGPLSDADLYITGTATYKVDNAYAVRVSGAANCWVRNVDSYKPANNATYHLLSGGIQVDQSRFITIDTCDMMFSQFRGIGGNGYLFSVNSEESLYQDCTAEEGRHNFAFNKMYTSGNVLLRPYSKKSQQDCDFHQFLSMANLIDRATFDQDMFESRKRTEVSNPAPGQTTTESVFWNTTGVNGYIDGTTNGSKAVSIISSHQQGNGYIIGTQGPCYGVDTTDYAEGIGKSAALIPASLYLDQRQKRLGF